MSTLLDEIMAETYGEWGETPYGGLTPLEAMISEYETTLGWPGPPPPIVKKGPASKEEYLKMVNGFVDGIRRNPKAWVVLLLHVRLHPDIWASLSQSLVNFIMVNSALFFPDLGVRDKFLNQVRGQLEGIAQDLWKRDRDFRLIDYEEHLLAKKLKKALDDLPPQNMEPILLKVLMVGPPGDITALTRLAADFVKQWGKLAEIGKSKAPDAHFALLGQALWSKATLYQSRYPSFKKKVEEERKK